MDPATQLIPGNSPDTMVHELQPMSCWPLKVYGGYPNPDTTIYRVHFEIILTTGLP
jgi:hypothetical protein